MTGETIVSEKFEAHSSHSVESPTSPTATNISGPTVTGDAVISIRDSASDDSRSETTVATSASASADDSDNHASTASDADAKRSRWPKWRRKKPSHPDVEEIKTRRLEQTINGYPRLAAFQSSENNFGLYRAFDYLHSRAILDLQTELTCLEEELDVLDGLDVHPDATAEELEGNNRLKSREDDIEACRTSGEVRTRVVVLKEIREKLKEYDELLLKAREVSSFQRPSNRTYRNVRRYFHNTKPLCDADMWSIRCKEDIVTLRQGREWANFDGVVERVLHMLDMKILQPLLRTKKPPLERLLCTPELHQKTTNRYIHYYSSSRINALVGIIITLVIFILLIVPVIAMYRLTSFGNEATTLDAVGVLVVFTMLFSAAMSFLTKASRHELFAASAAYCAILVVFISNFGGQGGSLGGGNS